MGLDLVLGGLVLVTAVRGWLRGFVMQAIRLGGLVAAVYAAQPVRDQLKPYALQYLPTVRPDLVDRLFWWVAAVLTYLVLVGVGSLVVSVSRRQPYGVVEPNRGDQFAGFGLGVAKGVLVASFLVAGVHHYGQDQVAKFAWAKEQTSQSYAWQWNEKYHPASRVWLSPPVQQFVAHVQKMGIQPPGETTPAPAATAARESGADRTPHLNVPPATGAAAPRRGAAAGPESNSEAAELSRTVKKLQDDLSRIETGR